MAAAGLFSSFRLKKLQLPAIQHVGLYRLGKTGVELFVTGQKPFVENRGLFLEILRRHPHTFGDVPHRLAHRQARVPKRVEDDLGDHFSVWPWFVLV